MAERTQKTQSIKPLDVFIVDGQRTPFLKVQGRPGPFSATDLAVYAGRELLMRHSFAPSDIDEVIIGCVAPRENEMNPARLIALRLGCGKSVPAYTVQRNCASGLQSIDSALKDIQLGRADLVLAGGTEAMSHSPLIFNDDMVNWLAGFSHTKSVLKKLNLLAKFRPKFCMPTISLIKGLTDSTSGLIMGKTAENLAYRFGITREEMDAFAFESHKRAANAQQEGHFSHRVTLFDKKGHCYAEDTGIRPDSSLEKLAQLKPFFDKKFGAVTAGNSAQVTDGAALLILANEKAVKKYQLPILGKIVDINWAALEPEVMGLGPVYASTPMLMRQHLAFSDIDYWEINEAFAVQVLACLRLWQDADFCKQTFGLEPTLRKINPEHLNVDGGAIALGHPVGASGARLALQLINTLNRQKAKRGVATLCIGGGQGGAILLETRK